MKSAPAWLRWWQSGWLAVACLVCVWCLWVGWLSLARHLAFQTSFDLGIFAQTVWATASGWPFYTSLAGGTTNFLGLHFAPLLAVLAPLYSLWPDARLLLLVQTVALAAAAIPLFAFARPRLGVPVACAVVVAYLLSPLLHSIALFDFHEIALAVPLLFAAGAALLDQRWRAMAVWLGLALLAKEEVALIAVAFGLYALLIQRNRRVGLALTAGATIWTALLFGWIMPVLSQANEGYTFFSRYSTLGGTPKGAVQALLGRPAAVLRLVAARPKLTFLWQVFASLGGIPLLGWPAILLALPTLAYLLLSDYVFMSSIRFHYTAPLLPFLFLASVVGLQRLSALRPRYGRWGAALMLVSAVVSALWWSPIRAGQPGGPSAVAAGEARASQALLATIPADAAVVTDWAYMPWLANRLLLESVLKVPFQMVAPDRSPDYVLTQTPKRDAFSAPIVPWLVRDRPGSSLRVPRFVPEGATPGGLVLSKWRGAEFDLALARYDAPFEQGLTLVAAGLPPEEPAWGPEIQAEAGTALPVWVAWGARQHLEQRVTFTLHLVDAAGGVVSQIDQEMGGGRFPTTLWDEWVHAPIVADEFPLPIPSDLPPGRYRLLAGAYESDSVIPLLRPDGGQWFELALVNVLPAAQPAPHSLFLGPGIAVEPVRDPLRLQRRG